MKTELLDYELPEALIAQEPSSERGDSRMMVLGASTVEHRWVRDFCELVPAGALVVLNDTRVRSARLFGKRRGTGGNAELLLLERQRASGSIEQWMAIGRANRPLRAGALLDFGSIEAEIVEAPANGDGTLVVILRTRDGQSVGARIEAEGHVPLPPYIRRADDERDRARYQTVFAKEPGAVAAPTAGLHLTHAMLSRLRERGVSIGTLTLHVGLGTFRPVTADDLNRHAMHAEFFVVTDELSAKVAEARRGGRPVVAVGTTVVRALESAADAGHSGYVLPTRGTTRLLIQSGYQFKVVDALLTNFHMPKSTLLALVGAFADLDRVLHAYRMAVQTRYRFLSYGDAMWIPERAR